MNFVMPTVEMTEKEKRSWFESGKIERMLGSIEENLDVYNDKQIEKKSLKTVYKKMSKVNAYERGVIVGNVRGQILRT